MPRPVFPCPCVVYIRFPSTPHKEYSYLCDFPVSIGDRVIANGTEVTVHRITSFDTAATRYVKRAPSQDELSRSSRICDIVKRLNELEKEQHEADRYAVLAKKSPEARKLLTELKKLRK